LGVSYDWRRETFAHRPDYYKWDQWFFLKMYEKGLVYKKLSPVNWCPKEHTVLSTSSLPAVCAGAAERLWKREILPQWFVRITSYADQLLEDMKEIEAGWPERVLTMRGTGSGVAAART